MEQRLTIELVPKTCWYNNVRSHVSKKEWDRIRFKTYEDADHVCEICYGKGTNHPVECHEIWKYDDEKHIQTLRRFIALCPSCHEVKHIGLASIKGNLERAMLHLMKINKWSRVEADSYVDQVWEIWEERSNYEWLLNIDILKEG